MKELEAMEADGLLESDDSRIQIKPAGRLLIRNICMVFDRYLCDQNLRDQKKKRFSRVI